VDRFDNGIEIINIAISLKKTALSSSSPSSPSSTTTTRTVTSGIHETGRW
jgi:hypothetical protein